MRCPFILLLAATPAAGADVASTSDAPSGDAASAPALDALSELIFSARTLSERVRAGWEPAPLAFARARAALVALNGVAGDGASSAPLPRAEPPSSLSCAAPTGGASAFLSRAADPAAEPSGLFSSWAFSDIMSIARLPLIIAAAFIFYRFSSARAAAGSGGSVSHAREHFGRAAGAPPGGDVDSAAAPPPPSSTRTPRSFRTSFAHAYVPTNAEEPLSSASDTDEDAVRARRVAHARVRSRASLSAPAPALALSSST